MEQFTNFLTEVDNLVWGSTFNCTHPGSRYLPYFTFKAVTGFSFTESIKVYVSE